MEVQRCGCQVGGFQVADLHNMQSIISRILSIPASTGYVERRTAIRCLFIMGMCNSVRDVNTRSIVQTASKPSSVTSDVETQKRVIKPTAKVLAMKLATC